MKVSDFDFDLPPGLIADRPAVPRDAARLLVVGDLHRDHGRAVGAQQVGELAPRCGAGERRVQQDEGAGLHGSSLP